MTSIPAGRSFARDLAKKRHPATWGVRLLAVGAVFFFVAGIQADEWVMRVGGVVALIGAVLFILRHVSVRATLALLHDGVSREAGVTAVDGRVVSYEYRDDFGKAYRGKQALTPEEASTVSRDPRWGIAPVRFWPRRGSRPTSARTARTIPKAGRRTGVSR